MIHPTNSNIFVKLLHRKPVESGGVELLIPDKNKRWQEDVLECEVVRCGPFAREVEPGDVVIIEGSSGKWIDNDLTPDPTEKYRMIDQSEILLVREAA